MTTSLALCSQTTMIQLHYGNIHQSTILNTPTYPTKTIISSIQIHQALYIYEPTSKNFSYSENILRIIRFLVLHFSVPIFPLPKPFNNTFLSFSMQRILPDNRKFEAGSNYYQPSAKLGPFKRHIIALIARLSIEDYRPYTNVPCMVGTLVIL